jgi:predicted DNA-binding protein
MIEYVTTNIRLPKEIYRELKQRALDTETSLAEVVRASVSRYLVASTDTSDSSVATDHTASVKSTNSDSGASSRTLRESPIAAYAVTMEDLAPRVVIEPQLYHRVEQASGEHQIGVDRFLTEAIRRYLWELDRRQISEESQIYQKHHAELKMQYLGQYIAMYNGQVVDHDREVAVLRQRVRQRFGWKPVMITLVEDVAERAFVRHGFRLETARP